MTAADARFGVLTRVTVVSWLGKIPGDEGEAEVEVQRQPMSRRVLLGGGLGATSAAILAGLTASTASGAVLEEPTARELSAAHVDLLIDLNQDLFVSGTVAEKPVKARGSLYGATSTVTGSVTKHPLAAIMTMRDQYKDGSGYETSARLTASIGDDAMVLSGAFKLDSQYTFTHGSIAGSDRGAEVKIAIEARDSGYGARLRGKFAGAAVDIAATIPGDGTGSVAGTLGRKHIELHLRQTDRPGAFPPARLTGTYSGSPEVLALIVGAVAYFG